LVFITAVESVYSAVRTDPLYKTDYVSSLILIMPANSRWDLILGLKG